METGQCICKDRFGGSRCDQCLPGFFKNQHLPFFQCDPCNCSEQGSTSEICDPEDGKCPCKENFSGRACTQCKIDNAFRQWPYPDCSGKFKIMTSTGTYFICKCLVICQKFRYSFT